MSKKGKKSSKTTYKPNKYEQQLSKTIFTCLDELINSNMEKLRKHQAGGDYKSKMKSGGKFRTLRYQRYRPELVAEIPEIILSSGLRFKTRMTRSQLKPLEEEVMH
ncbi:MAG: hypothetical protein EZS28_001244 [Streblomastix strix]|uniref:Uncharacterized protein n=1 Tax=Streblomastix strix TaxID=222440 RepID=A0A5J4X9N4_9EUKA|nr:MAG: hypothetical protein EZS28_001244 [Streblomastix strix]